MSDARKPWEIPVMYNDDRWTEPRRAETQAARAVSRTSDEDADERDAADVEELLNRPDDPDRHGNKTTDD
jgi:hypothetical protein